VGGQPGPHFFGPFLWHGQKRTPVWQDLPKAMMMQRKETIQIPDNHAKIFRMTEKKELTLLPSICKLAQLMARVCSKTGKKTSFGNTRSHSLRSTRRNWQVNMVKKRVFDPATGEFKTMKVAASYLRTLAKRIQQGKKV
jgi:large subunit ribosomal protein L28